jgi:16S rRNA (uracil1498-N3)-methyltransferase
LFDGRGGEAQAVIEQVTKRSVTVSVLHRSDVDRELPVPLELLVALPKGDRQKTLVDALVQLGVARLTPLECQRGVAQPSDNALVRLQRGVVEASKQCGRNRLLSIQPPISIEPLVTATTTAVSTPIASFFAHPYGSPRSLASVEPELEGVQGLRVAIGPEGGFTDSECALFQANGWQPLSLGGRILRIEVAAMMVAAWWAARQSGVVEC